MNHCHDFFIYFNDLLCEMPIFKCVVAAMICALSDTGSCHVDDDIIKLVLSFFSLQFLAIFCTHVREKPCSSTVTGQCLLFEPLS